MSSTLSQLIHERDKAVKFANDASTDAMQLRATIAACQKKLEDYENFGKDILDTRIYELNAKINRFRSPSRPRQSPYTVGIPSLVGIARDARNLANKATILSRASSCTRY